jgi:pimeloyl-ACP methyl ester carboxylesterase
MDHNMNRSRTIISTLLGAAAGTAAAWAVQPAHTPALQQGGSHSVATLEPVRTGGTELWTLQRGADVSNPVLLYLHGGPGISQLALNRANTRELEPYFTVVNWDQRGAGKSFRAHCDRDRMHLLQFVEDTAALSRYLLQKFGKQRLTLVGRSWGSAVGLLALARYPELYDAYVGIGQIAHTQESERASYQWTLEQAVARQDRKAIQELRAMGPPPYGDNWLQHFMTQRGYVCRYGGEVAGNPNGSNGKIARSVLLGAEYNLAERLAYYPAARRSMRLLQPELWELDLFASVPELHVPVFFMAGRHDHVVPQHITERYYQALQAPHKEWHWFERSAHMPDFEERARFQEFLVSRVRPMAVGA